MVNLKELDSAYRCRNVIHVRLQHPLQPAKEAIANDISS